MLANMCLLIHISHCKAEIENTLCLIENNKQFIGKSIDKIVNSIMFHSIPKKVV